MPDSYNGTFQFTPEDFQRYLDAQKKLNPTSTDGTTPSFPLGTLPDPSSFGGKLSSNPDLDQSIVAQYSKMGDSSQINPSQSGAGGILSAMNMGKSSAPPPSYSSDFLKQMLSGSTPSSTTAPNAAAGIGASINPPLEGAPMVPQRGIDSSAPASIARRDDSDKDPLVLDVGNNSAASVQGLKDAQALADQKRRQAALFSGIDLIGAGLNHAKPVNEKFFDEQAKDADIPVKDYLAQVAMEKKDPNSAVSNGFRDYLKRFGVDVRGDFSAEDAEKLMPTVLKSYEADQSRDARSDEKEFLAGQNANNLKYKYDELEKLAGIKAQDNADKRDEKNDQAKDKAYTDLRKNLETFRGNQAAQQASKDILSADKALQLVQGKDPDKLTTQDLALLAGEMSKIATGGVPTEHGTQQLMPHNLQTKFAELQNFMLSKPTDAQAGEYIRKNIKYLSDMRDTAKQTISDFRRNIAKGYKNRVKEDDYNDALADYQLNDKMPDSSAPASVGNQSPPQAPSLSNYGAQLGGSPSTSGGFNIDRDALAAEMKKRKL